MRNEDIRYIIVTSSDSEKKAPNNTQTHFISFLNSPIQCPDCNASVELCEITLPVTQSFIETNKFDPIIFDVNLHQVSGVIVNGCESNVLRRVVTSADKLSQSCNITFEKTYIVPVRLPCIHKFEFTITPISPKNISFSPRGIVQLTLALHQN